MIKIDKELTKILDKWLQWKWQYDEIAGISIGIMKDGKVFYKNQFGYMNLKKGVATTPLTTYRIASISKVFTGLGILKLVEQKKVKAYR